MPESVTVQNAGDFYGTHVQYGYMWWIKKIGSHHAFWAAGYGGQYLLVVPDVDIVVLCTIVVGEETKYWRAAEEHALRGSFESAST